MKMHMRVQSGAKAVNEGDGAQVQTGRVTPWRTRAMALQTLMTPLSVINAVDYGVLRHATVAAAVDTLLHSSQPHLLVIEHASKAAPVRIRGIISKTQVERQLGTQLLSSEIGG